MSVNNHSHPTTKRNEDTHLFGEKPRHPPFRRETTAPAASVPRETQTPTFLPSVTKCARETQTPTFLPSATSAQKRRQPSFSPSAIKQDSLPCPGQRGGKRRPGRKRRHPPAGLQRPMQTPTLSGWRVREAAQPCGRGADKAHHGAPANLTLRLEATTRRRRVGFCE